MQNSTTLTINKDKPLKQNENSENKRDINIDLIKGIGIILMVVRPPVHHTQILFCYFIWRFSL